MLTKLNVCVAGLKMGKTYEELQAQQNKQVAVASATAPNIKRFLGLALVAYVGYIKVFRWCQKHHLFA